MLEVFFKAMNLSLDLFQLASESIFQAFIGLPAHPGWLILITIVVFALFVSSLFVRLSMELSTITLFLLPIWYFNVCLIYTKRPHVWQIVVRRLKSFLTLVLFLPEFCHIYIIKHRTSFVSQIWVTKLGWQSPKNLL